IATAAVQNLLGGDDAIAKARTPQIMADAAVALLKKEARTVTGNTFLDVDVLRAEGITDLSPYGGVGDLEYDIFVDPPQKRHRA
ncbi:short chain dehydrogenase, partial [Nocardia sp. NPDC056952]